MKGGFEFLTDREFAVRLATMYNEVLALRKDDDYAVNQPQMDKFVEVLKFYLDAASDLNGTVEPVEFSPTHEHGGVTAVFQVFDLFGDQVQRFCKVMSSCSALSVDVTDEDKVCISCTVPNVFIQKSELQK